MKPELGEPCISSSKSMIQCSHGSSEQDCGMVVSLLFLIRIIHTCVYLHNIHKRFRKYITHRLLLVTNGSLSFPLQEFQMSMGSDSHK